MKKICRTSGKLQLNIQSYKIGQKNNRSFPKHLRVRSSVFKNEVFEEQVPNPIVRQHLECGRRLTVSNELSDFASLSAHLRDQGSH